MGGRRWHDGLDGHYSAGVLTMVLDGLASNATDLGEASSCHGRSQVRSEPCTLALRRTPSANVLGNYVDESRFMGA